MQDITEALNQIIFKYRLDQHYPHYRDMYEADRILRQLVEKIIAAGESAIFVCDEKTGNRVVRSVARGYPGISFCLYKRENLKALKSVNWKDFDRVYLLSFFDAEYVQKWFWENEISCEWIYEIFEQNGFYLQQEFYAFYRKVHLDLWAVGAYEPPDGYPSNVPTVELFFQKMKSEHANSQRAKRIALEKCLFLCVYMKDFIQAEIFIGLLEEAGCSYKAMWEEIQALLDAIRAELKARRERDVILYWLDAIPYGDECDMLYLKKQMDASVCFERAYASTAWTRSTLRALFLGKKEMDDHTYRIMEITDENSPLMQLLKNQDYDIKIVGSAIGGSFEGQYLSDHFPGLYEPCSSCFWDGLRTMLHQERKTFLLVHVMDAHDPKFCGRYRKECVRDSKIRYAAARQAIDEQMAFYDSFVGDDAFRIYMSDHGQSKLKSRHHILFNFYHKDMRPQKVSGLCINLDFTAIMRQMLTEGDIDSKQIVREYVEIEELDLYEYGHVKKRIEQGIAPPSICFAHKGIIDRDHLYIRFRTGKEFLTRLNDVPPLYPSLFYDGGIREPELLPYYRGLVKEFPPDIDCDEKFRYSQYLYKQYDKVKEKSRMRERVRCINELLSGYSKNSIAIRAGGAHSVELYLALSVENQDKIYGFIDYNSGCMCKEFHLPVVPPNQVPRLAEKGVKAVILSSWDYLESLRTEAAGYANMDVLDIYAHLEEKDLHCEGNFYEVTDLTPEEYDVGFPPKR